MPKSKKAFGSVQLQAYLDEPRGDGAVLPFTASTHNAVSTREAAKRQYLVSWEANWKRVGHVGMFRVIWRSVLEFFTGLLLKEIFGVLSDPAVAEIDLLHQHLSS
jgi:hypothetical protein